MGQKRYDNQERQDLNRYLSKTGKYRTAKHYIDLLMQLTDKANLSNHQEYKESDRIKALYQLSLITDIVSYLFLDGISSSDRSTATASQIDLIKEFAEHSQTILEEYKANEQYTAYYTSSIALSRSLFELWEFAQGTEDAITDLMNGLSKLTNIALQSISFLITELYNNYDLPGEIRKKVLKQIDTQCDKLATGFIEIRNIIFDKYKIINAFNMYTDIIADHYNVEELKTRKIDLNSITTQLFALNNDLFAVSDGLSALDTTLYYKDAGIITEDDVTTKAKVKNTNKIINAFISDKSKLLRPTNAQIDYVVNAFNTLPGNIFTRELILNIYTVLTISSTTFIQLKTEAEQINDEE